jgi:hypothetical protein
MEYGKIFDSTVFRQKCITFQTTWLPNFVHHTASNTHTQSNTLQKLDLFPYLCEKVGKYLLQSA